MPENMKGEPAVNREAETETDELKEQILDQQTLWNEGENPPRKAGGAPLGSILGKVHKKKVEFDVEDVEGTPPSSEETQYQGS